MRLLRETLPPHPQIPRRYDVLIVDEVHNCAPAGAGGRYARDTLRTAATRTLAPHCEHRLFLSATPHNGYDNSFAALLELLDPHRFARGIRPQREATREITVRRLKQDLINPDGSPRFSRRKVCMLEVEHPDSERAVHRDLQAYAAARAQRLHGAEAGRRASDFVTTLLKKRLFSSPAAFARTLEVHRATIERPARKGAAPPTPKLLQQLFEDVEDAGDDEYDEGGVGEAAREALDAAAQTETTKPSQKERDLLDGLLAWARRAAVTEDARTTRLLDWVVEQVKPGKRFTDERVIVFTEYRATQRYLQERLSARGIAGDRIELLDGTTSSDERERIKSQWQEPPSDYPVRVLLATDAASEGISLQRHCHLLAHAEIPWNPNRLEQRNGRVDRHGQSAPEVLVHHCVSGGWEQAGTGARGSLEGDLDFLARVVNKVEQIREDLGSAGPVIAGQVEEAMLGRRTTLDESRLGDGRALRGLLAQERRLRERLADLRDELHESRETLMLRPERVERVVRTALALARQPPLEPGSEAGTWIVPALTGSWSRATIGLEHPARPDERRPVTFDHDLARSRTEHRARPPRPPTLGLALALLRAEVWGTGQRLNRVTARYAEPSLGGLVAVAHGRLVITGATGHRLHEQGDRRRHPVDRRAPGAAERRPDRRRPGARATARSQVRSPTASSPASSERPQPCAARSTPGLVTAPARCCRRSPPARRTSSATSRRRSTSWKPPSAVRHSARTAPRRASSRTSSSRGDQRQVERDREALRSRLDAIPGEIAAEEEAVVRRYADPRHRLFPAAVTLLVPEGVRL